MTVTFKELLVSRGPNRNRKVFAKYCVVM